MRWSLTSLGSLDDPERENRYDRKVLVTSEAPLEETDKNVVKVVLRFLVSEILLRKDCELL